MKIKALFDARGRVLAAVLPEEKGSETMMMTGGPGLKRGQSFEDVTVPEDVSPKEIAHALAGATVQRGRGGREGPVLRPPRTRVETGRKLTKAEQATLGNAPSAPKRKPTKRAS